MTILQWILLQLSSYSVLAWATFVAITIASSYLLRAPGILLGHLLVAVAVFLFDVQWIRSEISEPGWEGAPDQDAIFLFGVLLRIVLINTALLPVAFIALRLRSGSWDLRGRRRDVDLPADIEHELAKK